MITFRASPASSASTEATHPTKSLVSRLCRQNARALGLHQLLEHADVRLEVHRVVDLLRRMPRNRRTHGSLIDSFHVVGAERTRHVIRYRWRLMPVS
jgi:hypothetical protein